MLKSFTVETLIKALQELPIKYKNLPVYMECSNDIETRYICLVDIKEKHIRITDDVEGIYETYSDDLTDEEFENGTDRIKILKEVQ